MPINWLLACRGPAYLASAVDDLVQDLRIICLHHCRHLELVHPALAVVEAHRLDRHVWGIGPQQFLKRLRHLPQQRTHFLVNSVPVKLFKAWNEEPDRAMTASLYAASGGALELPIHLLLILIDGFNVGNMVLRKLQAVGHSIDQHHTLSPPEEGTVGRQNAHCEPCMHSLVHPHVQKFMQAALDISEPLKLRAIEHKVHAYRVQLPILQLCPPYQLHPARLHTRPLEICQTAAPPSCLGECWGSSADSHPLQDKHAPT